MPSLLSSALAQTARNQSLLLLQSSTAQTCLPVLRASLSQTIQRARETTVVFCFLYRPSSLLDPSRDQLQVVDKTASISGYDDAHNESALERPSSLLDPSRDQLQVVDKTASIPGYDDAHNESALERTKALQNELLETIRSAPAGPLNVVLDSIDTILSDIGSLSGTAQLLSEVLALVRARGGSSRLVLHVIAPCPLIPILTQTRFSASLTHLIAHPCALLTHIATAYLTPPPPLSPEEKFWGVFIPIAERHYESEKLVFGPGGAGSGSHLEFVLEVLVRGGTDATGRRRGADRVFEGWSAAIGGPCDLHLLESLKPMWSTTKTVFEVPKTLDPTQNISFNLNLTPEQQRSRAQVPLPYAHEGKSIQLENTGAILYDPDSADDLDDDDPDEDLDI